MSRFSTVQAPRATTKSDSEEILVRRSRRSRVLSQAVMSRLFVCDTEPLIPSAGRKIFTYRVCENRSYTCFAERTATPESARVCATVTWHESHKMICNVHNCTLITSVLSGSTLKCRVSAPGPRIISSYQAESSRDRPKAKCVSSFNRRSPSPSSPLARPCVNEPV